LFRLLMEHNKDMLVSSPSLPPTVKVRTVPDTRCFDLSELVRDCDVDLDLPREPTPAVLAAKGLQLRDYQESSLRWMLDKETESVGLGLAGELWHRLRFLGAGSGEFFYCDLTGSWSLDIFDYRDDVDQKDASVNRFSMPTGGLLGEEVRQSVTCTFFYTAVSLMSCACSHVDNIELSPFFLRWASARLSLPLLLLLQIHRLRISACCPGNTFGLWKRKPPSIIRHTFLLQVAPFLQRLQNFLPQTLQSILAS
jgi:hypothetical protein